VGIIFPGQPSCIVSMVALTAACRLHIQYKYVVRNKDGSVVRWQEGANVSLELPGGPAEALALDVEDSWNKSKQIKRITGSW